MNTTHTEFQEQTSAYTQTHIPVCKVRQRGRYKEPAHRRSSPHEQPSPSSSSSPPAVSAGVPGKKVMWQQWCHFQYQDIDNMWSSWG